MNLYELTDAYKQLEMMIDEGVDGLEDTLESIDGAIEDKVESIIYIIRNKEARAAAFKREKELFADKERVENNSIKRLKEMLDHLLVTTNKDKVETPKFKTWLQNSPPSLRVVDESKVPSEWFDIPEPKPVLNKRGLLEHLKETGEIIDGVEISQSKHIRIK